MRMYETAVAAVLLASAIFIVTCVWEGTANSADQENSISASLKKPFRIVVESNPTTGYSWSPKFDSKRLRLKSSSYERPTEPRPGAGGTQVFVFVPLKEGRTEVVLEYRRPWEKTPVEKRRFEIQVSR
jgi:inhibitor of cysteine peptidase